MLHTGEVTFENDKLDDFTYGLRSDFHEVHEKIVPPKPMKYNGKVSYIFLCFKMFTSSTVYEMYNSNNYIPLCRSNTHRLTAGEYFDLNKHIF